ncbi:cell wall metabolism sensor histidine kinase WalK [Brevibacillus sp. AF8]|uniref:sensor histidine kinase n=1 Tax=Brevibacillus sp. AF8 TaxID=2825881 RepID=UPI001E5B86AA|nr:HAMP domain-containing sensor histidine kinase [Brevibacillus sp. AF8]MCE0452946.1 HAMP domain-containing histidine kinase [Brevibacillus sp. AF8]
MFRRTHMRLTIMNSVVFIMLIGLLATVIYFFTYVQLYKDVDRSLLKTAEKLNPQPRPERSDEPRSKPGSQPGAGAKKGPEKGPALEEFLFENDPRVITLVWNDKNELINTGPGVDFFQKANFVKKPRHLDDGEIQEIHVERFAFHVKTLKVHSPNGVITVQYLRNVNSEQELLDRLLVIIIIGSCIGVVSSVIAGYFLAGRALVPIQNSWTKQQQFVSDASHELRTPLAVIQAKTDLLFRSPAATIQEKSIDISMISNESRRLSKLVTNLLTLARSDSNQMEMKKQPFLLDEVLRDIVANYEEITVYQEKAITLHTPVNVSFTGDKERVHQLILIFLDNAMKYTEAGGEISLICEQTASTIKLKVKDDGIGMDEKEIPNIFERFYQSDKARAMAEGYGLGLSIAKWIIDKHHGKITVSSKAGEGTCFEITFPKNQK